MVVGPLRAVLLLLLFSSSSHALSSTVHPGDDGTGRKLAQAGQYFDPKATYTQEQQREEASADRLCPYQLMYLLTQDR